MKENYNQPDDYCKLYPNDLKRNTPKDFKNPNWYEINLFGDWKKHISDDLREIWHTFSDIQKMLIAENAKNQTDCYDIDL